MSAMDFEETIANNVAAVRSLIAEAAAANRRKQQDIQLIAVTKTQDWSACQAALKAGIGILGENRLQEAQDKIPAAFRQQFPQCQLHFIGQLQSNKIRKIVRLFDCVQSVDSLDHLRMIDREAAAIGKTMDAFIEVNTSGESSKAGVGDQNSLLQLVETGIGLANISLRGLMTVGPLDANESHVRAAFSQLRELSSICQDRFQLSTWGSLSMGMSGDYPWAIAEGATHVRIGTALFGQRPL